MAVSLTTWPRKPSVRGCGERGRWSGVQEGGEPEEWATGASERLHDTKKRGVLPGLAITFPPKFLFLLSAECDSALIYCR